MKFYCFYSFSFILPFIFSFWLEMQFLYYLGSLINGVGSGKFAVFPVRETKIILFYFIFFQDNFNIGKSKQGPEVPPWLLSRALDWESEILFIWLGSFLAIQLLSFGISIFSLIKWE